MPQDAFTLRHIARELNEMLAGGKVNKIIQPSRDEIDLLLYAGGKTKKLVLNTNASMARAVVSESDKSAPAVAPNFCMLLRKHLTGAQIISVAQVGFERILAFTFDCAGEFSRAERILYAEIMGKYSNLVLTEKGVISGALKISSLQENFKRVLFPGVKYALPDPQDKVDPQNADALAKCLQNYTGGDFADYLFARVAGLAYATCMQIADAFCPNGLAEQGPETLAEKIRAYIFSDETRPCVERTGGEAKDFYARADFGETYPSVMRAADAYYTEKEERKEFADKKRKLESLLAARRKKEEKKLALLTGRECECASMEQNRIFGELITANIYAVQRGSALLEAVNYYSENAETVRIPLDRTLSPAQNAQKYYKKYNKQKRTLAAIAPQKQEALADCDYTASMLSALSRAENMLDLAEIEEELKLAGLIKEEKNARKKRTEIPFRTFGAGDFRIFAGRNNVQNDRLLRAAAPGDIWLHAQKFHSAHVIVRTEGKKVPDEVLLAAAEICAYFSDGKGGGKIPVDYCERRYVKKPSGAKAGFVVYTDFKTLLVTPERHEREEIL